MKFVVDASFLVAAIETETGIADAAADLQERLLERHAFRAPMLITYELGNTLMKRKFAYPVDERSKVQASLLRGVELVPANPSDNAEVHALAARHELTFYDAAYLQLAAKEEDAVLLTTDGDLLAAGIARLGKDRAFDVFSGMKRFMVPQADES